MNCLKALSALPAKLARAISQLVYALGVLLDPFIGSVSWSPPSWFLTFGAAARRNGALLAQAAGVGAVVLLIGWPVLEWYLHRPMATGITLEVLAPDQTAYENSDGTPALIIHPLQIVFSDSAAPIEKVGKTVTDGITMDPAIRGSWRWSDDHTLQFTPSQDWPVGAHIEAKFDTSRVFAPHVRMADNHASFDVASFQIGTGTAEFYQDPQNAAAKKTIMPVTFTYPVDPASFESRISLVLIGPDGERQPLKFTVVYDAAKIKAWVHSQPLVLPRDNDAAVLSIDSGVRSSRGGEGTSESARTQVSVPGLYSLNVSGAQATLVDNEKYEPEQVIVLNTSDEVRGEDLSGLIKAFVLPTQKPGEKPAANGTPYDWTASEVSDGVLRASQPLKLEQVPTEKEYADAQSFKFHAEPGQCVYLRIAPGLKSFGGYLLGKADTEVLTVPDYPKLLRFMANGSLLSLTGDRRISIVTRNIPGVRVVIGRVPPGQLQHLVSFNDGTYTKPALRISEDHIVERFEKTMVFPKAAPGEAHYEGIDLREYLRSGQRGVFLLHLSTFDPKKKTSADAQSADATDEPAEDSSDSGTDPTDSRLVVVTDLGMVAKRALDGSRDVFVQSIRTGLPIDGAEVAVLALNGQVLFTATTGADGDAHFPTLKGLEHEKKPMMYVVRKGDDLSFLPIDDNDRSLDYSRFDIGGDGNAANAGDLSAYLFSDRGIYRPGDQIHVGVIVRTAKWAQSPAGIPLEAEIVDPRGMTVKRSSLNVDASGFAELSYTPADTAPTGSWVFNVHIVSKKTDDTPIGSIAVSVKEFLPDNFRVAASFSAHVAEGWVSPDKLKGSVDVHNLFGTAAAGRRVEGTLTLNPAFPTFRSWPGFQFYDLRRAKEGYTTALQDKRTDDQGHVEFDLDLKKYADATYRVEFLAKAHEADGGRSVAATAEALVSSNPWLIGYRAVDELSYVDRSAKRSVHLIAIDPQAKSIAVGGLQAVLIERRYVSVLTKQESGVYKYESRLKEVQIAAAPLAIPAGGMDYTLATDKPGDFALLIRSNGVDVNRVEYSITGEANLSRSLDRNAELQIKLDKQDYTPGASIEISLRAPYAGSGLMTIERDKVFAHAWFRADTTNSVQHITVPKGFEGTGYINVQYIRDPSSNEVFMSPLSYGVAPFSVNMDARRNALTVETPDTVKPGDTLTFRVHSPHPSKVVVFAVDEGILQVTHYKLDDPLKFFFRKRALDVETSQILDLILPDFKKMMSLAAPGGDAGNAVGRQLNPFKRRQDKPVVYWSGIVDVTGEKDLSYTVPDYFNGTLRVMAVSVSPMLIGTAEAATTVRGDFVLTPNVPTTLAPGDEAEISVGVANNVNVGAGHPVPVSVTLATGSGLQIIGNASQVVPIAAMHESVALFHVKATTKLGSAGLTLTAGYGGKLAARRVDLSVRPGEPYRTQVGFVEVAPANSRFSPSLRRMYDDYAVRTAAISTVPVVFAHGLESWLASNDNYCSEQIVSMAVPQLVASQKPAMATFSPIGQAPSGAAAAKSLAAAIDTLRTRQNDRGGFGLWTATPDAEPFVSAYAMNFLLEARDRGVAVPPDMIENGSKYLQQLAGDDSASSLADLRQRAYAVYLLTREGNVTTNDLAAVQKRLQDAFPNDWRNDLAAAWLAASYEMLKQDGQANILIAGLQRELERTKDNEPYEYGYYDDPLTRDATVLYLLAKHFPARAHALSPRALENIARPLEFNEFNTLSASMTILALDAYAASGPGKNTELAIDELGANGRLTPLQAPADKVSLARGFSGLATMLAFHDNSTVTAWGVVDQAGYDRAPVSVPIRNGLEIVREYTDTRGNVLDHFSEGQDVDVHLKIRATSTVGVGNVAIVDLLPGGFDPVTEPAHDDASADGGNAAAPSLGLPGSTFAPIYTDMREDRVVIYGNASSDVQEFVYRIRATSAGRFAVPPAYAELMYDRRVQARSPGGNVLNVSSVH